MFREVGVELRCVIVFLTAFADYGVEFLEIGLTEIVEFKLDSIEERFRFLFDSLHSLLSDIAVESGNVDDFSIFVNVVPGSRGEKTVALALLFKLVKIVSGLWCPDGLEFIIDGEDGLLDLPFFASERP